MNTEVFTERDIILSEPPIVFTKPWFARGWALGIFWASILSGAAAYTYIYDMRFQWQLMVVAALAWAFTLYKYIKGVRFIEVSGEVVRVYGRDVVTPIGEIPFGNMTLIRDTDEIFIIRKARILGGFSLKRVYWKNSFEHMNLVFHTNASYIMSNYMQMGGGDFDNIPTHNPAMEQKGEIGDDGILGGITTLYEFIVWILL